MKGLYRKFSVVVQIAITNRAMDSSFRIHCEVCGKWCPKRVDYEIDHVIPEGMRPAADLLEKLKPADGQLLCRDCHDKKTDKDKGEIALAVRREAYHAGVERPGKQKMRSRTRKERTPYRPAAGQSQIARRYGL